MTTSLRPSRKESSGGGGGGGGGGGAPLVPRYKTPGVLFLPLKRD